MVETVTTSAPRKIRRNPRACDVCSRRSVRCQPSQDGGACQNCIDFNETCKFDRPVRKRGAKSKQARAASNHAGPEPVANKDDADVSKITGVQMPSLLSPTIPRLCNDKDNWKPSITLSQAMVMDLTEIYFEVVYPVFPFFHRSTLVRRVSRGEHMTNRAFFASVMALCALSSARVRDGALYSSSKWDLETLREPTSEEMFRAAEHAMPQDATLTADFDSMRACVLLSITSIQYQKVQYMSHYLGLYNMFVAVGRLHDEAHWPKTISIVEVEERRRLFWSTYTLDVFTSVVWGGIVRSREASSNVAYPTEIDDEHFSNAGYSTSVEPRKVNWLQGWNLVTDLYRILEHSVDHLRRFDGSAQRSPYVQAVAESSIMTSTTILDQIRTMYSALPNAFKVTGQMTGNFSDLFSFQAANIAATVQLVRMVHFTKDQSTLEQKCQVAGEVIAGFASVPVPYLRAMSSPLLHHLAGIGTILGAAFKAGMTESSYRNVRSVLLDLASLLSTLEVNLYCPSETSDKLRQQVARIDEFMSTQPGIPSSIGGYASYEQAGTAGSNAVNSQSRATEHATAITESPEYCFPPELFEDWSWALDLTSV